MLVQKANHLNNMPKKKKKNKVPYWWNIRVFWRQMKIKEEKTILIRCSICSHYYSPQKIHSILINSNIDSICCLLQKNIYLFNHLESHNYR
ncbi:hypothetical protein HanIR_Chr12g0602091 [Helianthus annuus]|nr:hypothetical protein HanIR_Chr12g0602091 [Helianthus annuus]